MSRWRVATGYWFCWGQTECSWRQRFDRGLGICENLRMIGLPSYSHRRSSGVTSYFLGWVSAALLFRLAGIAPLSCCGLRGVGIFISDMKMPFLQIYILLVCVFPFTSSTSLPSNFRRLASISLILPYVCLIKTRNYSIEVGAVYFHGLLGSDPKVCVQTSRERKNTSSRAKTSKGPEPHSWKWAGEMRVLRSGTAIVTALVAESQ